MSDFDWRAVVRQVAPVVGGALGTAVGGPVGPLAAMAVKALSDQLLGKPDGTVEEVAQAVQDMKPEDLFKLKSADQAYQIRMRELDIQEHQADLGDVKDARARDVAIVQAGKTNERANWMIALDVTGLLFCLGGMVGLGWFRARYADAITEGVFSALLVQLTTIAGIFGLCLRDAHQFEFGSSRGSREKDQLIALSPPVPVVKQ